VATLRDSWQPPAVNLKVISSHGGLGDQIARLPAYRHVLLTYPHVNLMIYVQDYFLDLAEYLMPGENRLKWRALSTKPEKLEGPIVDFDPQRISSKHLHLTQQAFLMLTDSLADIYGETTKWTVLSLNSGTNIYLSDIENGVIFTPAYTAESRKWLGCHVNGLAKRVRDAGFTPVLLADIDPINTGVEGDPIIGRLPDDLDRSLFLDLTNRTTLIEALGIIQRSKAVVGVDNGLLHLAHCTDVPVVYGFSTLSPEHRLPVRSSGTTSGFASLTTMLAC
jgi:hypothetical protein